MNDASSSDRVTLRNGRAISRGDVPHLEMGAFREVILGARARTRRVSALFAAPGAGERLDLYAVLAVDGEAQLEVTSTTVEDDAFDSMTPGCPEVHLFEREIAEQWGVLPRGHPWLKPVRFVRSRRPGKDAWGRSGTEEPLIGVMDFYRVEGDEVHEVAVGPVHAGVIEPVHFRFQCYGENVLHLEISLGYQHRGVERSLLGGPSKRTIHTMETLAGDTTIGHATAFKS